MTGRDGFRFAEDPLADAVFTAAGETAPAAACRDVVFMRVIAVGGVLLYLEARSRSRVAGYVLARRLGLTRAAHLRSLLVELGGVAAVGLVLGGLLAAAAGAGVYRRLDVDPVRPPTPLLDVPGTAIVLTAVAAAAVAALAAGHTQRAADRADPAAVLREDA